MKIGNQYYKKIIVKDKNNITICSFADDGVLLMRDYKIVLEYEDGKITEIGEIENENTRNKSKNKRQ